MGVSTWVYDREEWGALDNIKSTGLLSHPIRYVLIFHGGGGKKPCTTFHECSVKMRAYQDTAISKNNLSDIQGNFYVNLGFIVILETIGYKFILNFFQVGKDGGIYVGRSWNIVNSFNSKSLAIGFLGDYEKYETNYEQITAVLYLLDSGVQRGYLDEKYKLIARNQVTYFCKIFFFSLKHFFFITFSDSQRKESWCKCLQRN